MNTLSAAQLLTNNAAWNSKPNLKEVTLPNGGQIIFTVTAITSMPMRVTEVWTDVPGPVQPATLDPTNRTLVNDLDLRIIGPDGMTNFPWVLDPAFPTNAATRGDNVLDNVEQVVIENTTTGVYTIVISHKGSLSNEVQDVSILLSGIQPEDKEIKITGFEILSNNVHRLTWDGAVGSLYTVMGSANLITDGWSELSDPIGIIQEQTTWLSETSTLTPLQFYRIQQEK